MTTELLRTIIERPDEDAPRLIYADWLEERSGEVNIARAEFIRIQCDLANLPYDDDRCSDLRVREYRLLSKYHSQWKEGFQNVGFRRGFLEVYIPEDSHSFLEESPELFAKHPIRDLKLEFDEKPGWGEIIASSPLLSRVETLRLTYLGIGESLALEDFLAVVSSKQLTNLETLDASGGNLFYDRAIYEMLGTRGRASPIRPGNGMLQSLKKLRKLSISEMGLSDQGVEAIVKSPLARQLTHLDLSKNIHDPYRDESMTPAGINTLIQSPLWSRLHELHIGHLELLEADQTILALAEAISESQIRKLGIGGISSHESNSTSFITSLAEVASWGKLRTLSFSFETSLNSCGLRAFLNSPNLKQVKNLSLDHCQLEAPDIEALAASENVAGLTLLNIATAKFNASTMEALAKAKHLNNLVVLDLSGKHLTDETLELFVQSPNAAKLQLLAIPESIGDRGIQAIAKSPYLSRLNHLEFSWLSDDFEQPGDTGALALANSCTLPNLAFVDAKWGNATERGIHALLDCERLAWFSGLEPNHDFPELEELYESRFKEFQVDEFEWADPEPRFLFPWASSSLD
ncbi:MAG: TIGR02996 domain-containing protein [Gemmataceae bacterium]